MSRASAELVDDSDVPPAGTPCRGCRGLGHFCPAKCYRGESTALCRACANGVDCEVVAVKLRREEEILLGIADPQLARFDHPASAPRDVTPVDPAKLIAPPDREEVYRNSTGRAIAPFVASAKTPPVFPHARPSREVVRPAPSSVRSRVISHDDEEFDKSQIEEEPLKVQSPPFHFTAAHLDLIRNAPATQTDRELSELIGCKASAIWYQRSKIRKQPAAGVQSTAIAKKTPAKKVALCGREHGRRGDRHGRCLGAYP